MENKSLFWQSFAFKIISICVLALLMLIPLGMIRSQISDRSGQHARALEDISGSWGKAQTISGPWLDYSYLVEKDGNEKGTVSINGVLYPDTLRYGVSTVSKELHRSIYDVNVYTADITIEGNFVLDSRILRGNSISMVLNMGDIKGIQGYPFFSLDGEGLKVRACTIKNGEKGQLTAEVELPKRAKRGDILSFNITLKVKGAESLNFTPAGSITEVDMTSDYPDPSFCGDYLPSEREIGPEGFTAKWQISQITMSGPLTASFGVKLTKPVTQYRQTERATKYGLLVILLVFVAGFVVEMVSKRPINIIQYLIIGASLVLFYSLLLAFADFLAFGLAYLIAAVMTTASMGGYFIGIMKNKWAYILTALVAIAYGVIYVLLQMEIFAFLTGTLLLFLILCIIMFLTRKLNAGGGTNTTENA